MTMGPLIATIIAQIVKHQPFPIARIMGSAMIPETVAKMFLIKLFAAIPCDAFLGMNSVNIVVTMPKMSIVEMPKKKFAIN